MAIEPILTTSISSISVPQTDGPDFSRPAENESAAYVSLSTEQPKTKEQKPKEANEPEKRSANKLTPEETKKLRELQARDREVRTHEQAHLAALGPHKSGGANFSMEIGPDGRQYAVGGEVPVDVSPEKTPEETIRKAQTIRRAALAPADPSGADRSVAASAAQMEAEARAELAKEGSSTGTIDERSEKDGTTGSNIKAHSQYREIQAGLNVASLRSRVDIRL